MQTWYLYNYLAALMTLMIDYTDQEELKTELRPFVMHLRRLAMFKYASRFPDKFCENNAIPYDNFSKDGDVKYLE